MTLPIKATPCWVALFTGMRLLPQFPTSADLRIIFLKHKCDARITWEVARPPQVLTDHQSESNGVGREKPVDIRAFLSTVAFLSSTDCFDIHGEAFLIREKTLFRTAAKRAVRPSFESLRVISRSRLRIKPQNRGAETSSIDTIYTKPLALIIEPAVITSLSRTSCRASDSNKRLEPSPNLLALL